MLLATDVPDIVGVLSYVGLVTLTVGDGTVWITSVLGELVELVCPLIVAVAVIECVAIVKSDPGVNDQFPLPSAVVVPRELIPS